MEGEKEMTTKNARKCDWSSGICQRTFIKEAREHPTLPKATVRRIVKDHLKMR